MAVVDFVIKARDEASAAIQRVSGATTDLRGALSGLVTSGGALGIVAAGVVGITGALLAAGAAGADLAEDLDRSSKAAGTTTENIQVLRRVFGDFGLEAGQADEALKFMNRAIGRSDPLLKQLGITTRDSYEAVRQLADIFGRSDDAAKKQAVALKLLGKSSGELVGVMGELGGAVDATRDKMRKNGGIVSQEQLDRALKLDTQLDELKGQWKDFATAFQMWAVPAATGILKFFTAMTEAAVGFGKSMRDHVLGPLAELQAAKASQQTFEDRLAEAKAEAAKVHGYVQVGVPTVGGVEVSATRLKKTDSLSGVDVTEEKAAKDARVKRLEELTRVLGVTRREAERLLQALEKVEGEKRRAELTKKLQEANALPLPSPEYKVKPRDERQGPTDEQRQREREEEELAKRATAERVEATRTWKAVLTEVRDEWSEFVADQTSGVAILNESFGALYNGLQSGFGAVFANLTNKAQTFRSAMRTIFSALVQEVLAMLARIAAAKLFGFILKLIPGLGTAAGIAVDTVASAATSAPSSASSLRPSAPVVNIYAMDAAGVANALQSPRGSLRRAMTTTALAGAY